MRSPSPRRGRGVGGEGGIPQLFLAPMPSFNSAPFPVPNLSPSGPDRIFAGLSQPGSARLRSVGRQFCGVSSPLKECVPAHRKASDQPPARLPSCHVTGPDFSRGPTGRDSYSLGRSAAQAQDPRPPLNRSPLSPHCVRAGSYRQSGGRRLRPGEGLGVRGHSFPVSPLGAVAPWW
jgi:hypothetical protein